MQSQTPKDQEKVQRKPRKTNKKPNIPKKKREVKFEVKKEFE